MQSIELRLIPLEKTDLSFPSRYKTKLRLLCVSLVLHWQTVLKISSPWMPWQRVDNSISLYPPMGCCVSALLILSPLHSELTTCLPDGMITGVYPICDTKKHSGCGVNPLPPNVPWNLSALANYSKYNTAVWWWRAVMWWCCSLIGSDVYAYVSYLSRPMGMFL